MLKIGLTGGIGSGKTTVARFFEELGIKIIDADEIARRLTTTDQPAYEAIIDKVGIEILTAEGEINRRRLKEMIFSNPSLKTWLENLLHPTIKQVILQECCIATSPYVIIVIPLLVETNAYDLIDRVLVVDSSVAAQISRTVTRDRSNEEAVVAIIKSQASREQRLAVATDIINNNDDLEDVRQQVLRLHQLYLTSADKETLK